MPIHYTVKDVKRATSYFARGSAYFKQGRVKQVVFSEEECLLTGNVKGNASHPYTVEVRFINQISRGLLLYGKCSCPMEKNCKHVAAVLLAGLERLNGKEVVDEAALDLEFEKFNGKGAALELEEDKITDYRTAEWMMKIEQVLTPSHVYPPTHRQETIVVPARYSRKP